jgi:integrase
MPKKGKPWLRAGRGWYGYVDGKQVALGVPDPEQYAAAVAALNLLLSKSKPLGPVDWGERVRAFLEGRASTGAVPKTVAWYGKYLAHFVARFGTLHPAHLTKEAIELSGAVPTWGDNTRRNYLAAVQTFLKWAGYPIALNMPGRESAGAGAVISEAVYNQALGAARGDLKPLVRFLWHTGCRPAEATALTGESVDWDAGTITLKRHKTRRATKKARILYLSPAALDVLREQHRRHGAGLLFPNRAGGQWRTPALTQALWRISAKIGHRVTAYGFRHSYATRALERGTPDTHVAALMGHTSTRMIHAHYSHLDANARLLKGVAASLDRTDGAA